MRKVAIVSVFACLFVTGACSEDVPGNGGTLAALDLETVAQAEVLCDCYEAGQLDSREECLEFIGGDDGPSRIDPCVIEAHNVDIEGSAASLNCELQAQRHYTDCMRASLECTDESSLDECVAAREYAFELCPGLPKTVLAALNACFG